MNWGVKRSSKANRGASWYYDEDGSLVLRARLPAEAGALLVKALELASEVDHRPILSRTDVPAGTSGAPGGHVMPDIPEMADWSEAPLAQPLDVGRKTRIIPPTIRRALRSRDPGCRFPGCTHTQFLDGHHIKHWINGGETKLSNLMMLCRFHHRQVHEGRVRVQVLDDGALRFTGSHGQRFVLREGLTGDADQLIGEHLSNGIAIDEDTAVTHRFSERRDYGRALESLLMPHAHRQGESPNVPAGAPGPSVGGA